MNIVPRFIVSFLFLLFISFISNPLRAAEASEYTDKDPCLSIQDYLRFAGRYSNKEIVRSDSQLAALFQQRRFGEIPMKKVADLKSSIIDDLNIRLLLEKLEKTLVPCTIIKNTQSSLVREEFITLHDPYVGDFTGILLIPAAPVKPHVILALHGHSENAEFFRDKRYGKYLAEKGFAVFMITFRGMCGDKNEDLATRTLLKSGYTFIGLQAYECMVAIKYLKRRNDLNSDKFGLLGHSGGSAIGNLLVRISNDLGAYVSDHQVNYFDNFNWNDELRHDTAPAIYPYYEQINDFSSLTIPHLELKYGFNENQIELYLFFQKLNEK